MSTIFDRIFNALGFAITIWYCYDDWLASQFNNPNIGTVPFFIWLICFLIAGYLTKDQLD